MIGSIYGDMKIIEINFTNKSRKKVKVECLKCGYQRWMFYYSLIEGHGNSHEACIMHFSRNLDKDSQRAFKKFQNVYHGLKQRCEYPNHIDYKRYGARGIRCEFVDLMDFTNKMWPTYREGLSIDRKDNNGNYCQDNCHWVTARAQAINRRTTIPVITKCLDTGKETTWECLADFLRWFFGDNYRPGYGTHAKRCMENNKPYKGYMIYLNKES